MKNTTNNTMIFNKKSGILVLVAVAVSCILAFQFIAKRCIGWECPPTRKFTVHELNLPNDFLPREADLNPLHADRVPGTLENAITTNYWNGGLAIYMVLRLPTIQEASEWYEFDLEGYKFSDTLENSKPYSKILAYRSEVADQSAIKCGYVPKNDLRCVFWARYQEYYIFFSGSMGEDGEMTQTNFLNILIYIDEKMRELLDRN
jgi:hypothetical protein